MPASTSPGPQKRGSSGSRAVGSVCVGTNGRPRPLGFAGFDALSCCSPLLRRLLLVDAGWRNTKQKKRSGMLVAWRSASFSTRSQRQPKLG